VSVGSDEDRAGGGHFPEDGELPGAVVGGVDWPDSVSPWGCVEAGGFAEVEEHGAGVVEESVP
jgi:hypothetical protein